LFQNSLEIDVCRPHGASVAIVGRNLVTCDEVCSRITEAYGKAKLFYADAINPEDLEHALIEIIAWTGRVDILMNCPGTNSTTLFFDLTMDEWDKIMDVNIKGVVLACQIFGKRMVEQGEGGSIINISSVS
jgi:NAD(P)-dependent dehydrogenase (short-subunit alcohol dehydrogenase family)